MTDEQNEEQNEEVEGHPRIKFEAEEQVEGHPRVRFEAEEQVEGHPRIRFEADEQVEGHPGARPPELVEGHSFDESGQERVTHDDGGEVVEGHGTRRPAPEE